MPLDELIPLHVDVRISSDNRDDYEMLAPFYASFYTRDDADEEVDVGGMTGWIIWSADGEDLATAADSLDADAAYIGGVAHRIMDELREDDPFLDDALLLDRVWIERPWRGTGLLGQMLERLLELLRLDVSGCVVVTEPEPQRDGGGPYPGGPIRDAAMEGLVRSLSAAGFERYREERAMWKLATRD
jgi:GNAT superfamily N-acetyltransferase